MPVMVPLVSDLNETPSSTAPVAPLSTEAGTAVLGQIVCWADMLVQKDNAIARLIAAIPVCLKNLTRNCRINAAPTECETGFVFNGSSPNQFVCRLSEAGISTWLRDGQNCDN